MEIMTKGAIKKGTAINYKDIKQISLLKYENYSIVEIRVEKDFFFK